mmetsp:Transcript_18307/g.44151  ORF Transcript_18307/g.44151 Transcript_18307/m.44151 type:complete len:309 (-) Transcript_18307:527-1453(-)
MLLLGEKRRPDDASAHASCVRRRALVEGSSERFEVGPRDVGEEREPEGGIDVRSGVDDLEPGVEERRVDLPQLVEPGDQRARLRKASRFSRRRKRVPTRPVRVASRGAKVRREVGVREDEELLGVVGRELRRRGGAVRHQILDKGRAGRCNPREEIDLDPCGRHGQDDVALRPHALARVPVDVKKNMYPRSVDPARCLLVTQVRVIVPTLAPRLEALLDRRAFIALQAEAHHLNLGAVVAFKHPLEVLPVWVHPQAPADVPQTKPLADAARGVEGDARGVGSKEAREGAEREVVRDAEEEVVVRVRPE